MPMLHHTGLTISDLDRSLRFWRDAMGMRVLFEQEKPGGYLEGIVGDPALACTWCIWRFWRRAAD